MNLKQSILILLAAVCVLPAQTKKMYILFSNDVHGGIVQNEATFLNPNFPPMLGGGASAAGIIKSYRQKAQKEGDIFFLFDAGDMFQGTLLGTKTAGKAIVDYMNRVDYDLSVAGNHDFDLGKDNLLERSKQAHFPILSANIIDTTTGKPFAAVKPWVIIERQGIKFGIFGLTTEATKNMSFSENIKNLDFTPEAPAARKAIKELKANGAEIIMAVVHMGLPYNTEEGYKKLQEADRQNIKKESYLGAMELAHYVPGIDILFGGHIHKGYNKPWSDPINHTLCFQNYGNGGNIGLIEIDIDVATKSVMGYHLPASDSDLLLLTEDEFWPDTEVANSIKEQQNKVEKGFDDVIGVTETALTRTQGESPMNNLICDALIEASGADFSFTNFGGVRSDLQIGPLTPRDIFKVLPFGNTIVVIAMKGAQLRKLIESKISRGRSGLAIGGGKIVFEKNRPDGDKITSFSIAGKPLQPDAIYKVAMSDYLAEGNSGLSSLADIPEEDIDRTGIIMRTAVRDYVARHTPLKIKLDGRWIKK